jgi:hypothetical protein
VQYEKIVEKGVQGFSFRSIAAGSSLTATKVEQIWLKESTNAQKLQRLEAEQKQKGLK